MAIVVFHRRRHGRRRSPSSLSSWRRNDPGCLIKECDELFHLYGGLPDEEEAADAGSFWAPITSGWSAPSAPPRLSVRPRRRSFRRCARLSTPPSPHAVAQTGREGVDGPPARWLPACGRAADGGGRRSAGKRGQAGCERARAPQTSVPSRIVYRLRRTTKRGKALDFAALAGQPTRCIARSRSCGGANYFICDARVQSRLGEHRATQIKPSGA